jgi:hypothetical protein
LHLCVHLLPLCISNAMHIFYCFFSMLECTENFNFSIYFVGFFFFSLHLLQNSYVIGKWYAVAAIELKYLCKILNRKAVFFMLLWLSCNCFNENLQMICNCQFFSVNFLHLEKISDSFISFNSSVFAVLQLFRKCKLLYFFHTKNGRTVKLQTPTKFCQPVNIQTRFWLFDG